MTSSPRWLALAFLALLLTGCVAEGRIGGSIITGGHHEIGPDVVLDGHLLMVDGRFSVARGATIAGSAFVIGGELRLNGRLSGDLTLLGGRAELGPESSIGGDIRVGGGELRRDPAAKVAGSMISGIDAEAALGLVRADEPSLAEQVIRFAIQLAGLLVLAALTARWLDTPADRIGEAIRRRTLLAVAAGMLAVVVGLTLVVFMAFTVVLIPVALFVALGYGMVLAFAWVSFGRQLGRWLGRRTHRPASPLGQTLVGTLLLTTAAALIGLVPLVGDVAIIAVLLACVGAAVVTRLGTAMPARRA